MICNHKLIVDPTIIECETGVVKNVQTITNIKGKNLWMPLRYAITLEAQGPDLKLIVDLFGREKCMLLAQSAYEL